MRHWDLAPIVCAFALLLAMPAWAEKADKQKPINIEADDMRHDDAAKVSVWNGNVIMTKGTMVMRAAKIDVKESSDGSQLAAATAKPGERVFFRQKREGHDEFMEGEATRIDYDSKADVVTLEGRAVLRRLKGAALADESTGQKIVFNNNTETMAITGAPAATGKPPERVRAMLSPKESSDKAGAGTTNANASTASTPALKATPNLKP